MSPYTSFTLSSTIGKGVGTKLTLESRYFRLSLPSLHPTGAGIHCSFSPKGLLVPREEAKMGSAGRARPFRHCRFRWDQRREGRSARLIRGLQEHDSLSLSVTGTPRTSCCGPTSSALLLEVRGFSTHSGLHSCPKRSPSKVTAESWDATPQHRHPVLSQGPHAAGLPAGGLS